MIISFEVLDICGGFLVKIAFTSLQMWKVDSRPTSASDFFIAIFKFYDFLSVKT
jgi:hypothetical protein